MGVCVGVDDAEREGERGVREAVTEDVGEPDTEGVPLREPLRDVVTVGELLWDAPAGSVSVGDGEGVRVGLRLTVLDTVRVFVRVAVPEREGEREGEGVAEWLPGVGEAVGLAVGVPVVVTVSEGVPEGLAVTGNAEKLP